MIIPGRAAAAPVRNAWPGAASLPPLAPFPSVPAIARDLVRVSLPAWGLAALADDAAAVVTELATNAVAASIAPDGNPRWLPGNQMPLVWVRLLSDRITLLAEVLDMAPGVPFTREAGPDAEDGRGLAIVSALAAQWGWNETRDGKVVWAALKLGG